MASNPTVIEAADVPVVAMIVVKHALALYINTGMKANRAYTPKNMRAFVSRLTGKTYRRTELAVALADLTAHIAICKAARVQPS